MFFCGPKVVSLSPPLRPWRWLLQAFSRARWRDRDLHDAVSLRREELERVLDVVEPEVVRDERRQIDAPVRDHRHQPPHPLFSARAQRRHDLLIAEARVERIVGSGDLAGIHAQARERASRPGGAQRVLERGLLSERLDGDVGAAAVGQPLDFSDGILFAVVDDDIRAESPGHVQPAPARNRRR